MMRGLAVVAGLAGFLAADSNAALQIRLKGDSSPAANSLSHVYLLAWFQESGEGVRHEALGAWSVANALKNDTNTLDVTTSIDQNVSLGVFDDPIGDARFSVIGIYEDGGVSISMLDSAFIPGFSDWSSIFETPEDSVQSWLQSGDTESLANWFRNELVAPGYAPEMGYRASQVDFSIADVNGSAMVEMTDVPAPGALVLGALGVAVGARRRRR
ncbi:MAG: hypothetical protein U0570_08090 [Phycisphaerales bacterium]